MMLPGFNRAIIRVPIFGRVRKFKNPSGVLNTTEHPSAVACAVPVAKNSTTHPAKSGFFHFILYAPNIFSAYAHHHGQDDTGTILQLASSKPLLSAPLLVSQLVLPNQ